jgi:hypothetical protein
MRLCDHVALMANQYQKENPKLRKGQTLFIVLENLDSEIADMIRGTDADPFYNDKNIRKFWETI